MVVPGTVMLFVFIFRVYRESAPQGRFLTFVLGSPELPEGRSFVQFVFRPFVFKVIRAQQTSVRT